MFAWGGSGPEDHEPKVAHSPEPGGDPGELEHWRGFADPVEHTVMVCNSNIAWGLGVWGSTILSYDL